MRKTTLFFAIFIIAAAQLFPAIVVTSPSAQTAVKACAEFSDEVLRDRWDMNARTDLGWRIFNSVELPQSYLTNISFSGGIFSAKTVATSHPTLTDYSDMSVSILDSHYPGSLALEKVGSVYPINADKYTVLVLRMYLGPAIAGKNGILYWSKNTIYSGVSWSNPFDVYDGWYYYFLDIPAIGLLGGSDTWSGWIDSLRIDPIYKRDKDIQIDWIRLVQKDALLTQTITWTGNTGNVDIYLDNNSSSADGALGLLAKNVSGTSYSFLAGGLAAGDYYVAVVPTGTSVQAAAGVAAYSSGYYRVNDVPIIQFTKPSEEGSSEDFATMTFADPWDMANNQDIEKMVNVTSPVYTTLNYQDLAGNNYVKQTVFEAWSAAAVSPLVGDPATFLLHWVHPDGVPLRGRQRKIYADKYHNFVAKLGIYGDWNVLDGSIARVAWKNVNESVENVSADIIIRHLNSNSADYGPWIMNKLVFDLKRADIHETDVGGSPSKSGWTGWLDAFRLDPHEFSSPRQFFYDDVKITADWTANTQFVVNWTITDAASSPTVSLYYDSDSAGYDGTLIAANLDGTTGSYTWNVTNLAEGKYWLYALVSDGTNDNRAYAGGPLIVDHDLIPQIALSEDQIFVGVVNGLAVTSKEKVLLTNVGQGTLNWTVAIDPLAPFIKVSPMSGTGNAVLEVSIDTAAPLPATGPFWGTITVTDAKAWNSPQVVELWGTVYAAAADAAPFGTFETPADNSTVSGNIPVTGWVLDDVEVVKVEIKRNSHASDPPAAIGPDGLVYIGDGTFVKGARPDVEYDYYQYPRNDRAGWGYMMLTNFLPNQGNGDFTIYAYASDGSGHTKLLGTKTITCNNSERIKPFGTIDTPAQGGIASGAFFVNFGWALTALPKTIPFDGSTIGVYVDGVPLGTLNGLPNVYNQYREDVSNNFPGLNNSGGPVGGFYLDTTKYENKVHSIYWLVTDDAGETDGIGSRFFEIQNTGQAAPVPPSPPAGLFGPIDHSGRLMIELAQGGKNEEETILRPERRLINPPIIKKAVKNGLVEMEIEELGMMEIHFAGSAGMKYLGWGAAESKDLPIGSTLDRDKGIFYWIPGPGFLGRHVLHFAVTDGRMKSRPLEVVVNIVPKAYPKAKK